MRLRVTSAAGLSRVRADYERDRLMPGFRSATVALCPFTDRGDERKEKRPVT
jgi:hypothetical protein